MQREQANQLTTTDLIPREEARVEYKKWVMLEKIFLRKKSREIRLKEGIKTSLISIE